MSGVILRCPHCGTAQTETGTCDACHEAEVRYFCTNHTPGLWLDAQACTKCGARFGEAARAPAPPPVAPPRPRPARAGGAAPPARSTEEVFGRFEEPPHRHEPTRPSRPPTLAEMIAAAARARAAARPPGMPPPAPSGPRMGGCLVRAVLMFFVFLLMVVSSMFMFAGSFFRVW